VAASWPHRGRKRSANRQDEPGQAGTGGYSRSVLTWGNGQMMGSTETGSGRWQFTGGPEVPGSNPGSPTL
jgi:hypothetical protein